MNPETLAMALFVSRNLKTASDAELHVASNVLWAVRSDEAGDALARVLREIGRRLANAPATTCGCPVEHPTLAAWEEIHGGVMP